MQAKRSRLLGKAQRTPSTGEPSPLLPQWAFVVQFRTETDVKRGRCTGRVEHVVSGQATHFESLEELLAFMARVLTTVRAPPLVFCLESIVKPSPLPSPFPWRGRIPCPP